MIDLVLATGNAHKVQEIQSILSSHFRKCEDIGLGFRIRSLKDFPQAPAMIEDGDTFAANATRKATQLAQWLGTDALVLADDSGLEVDALNGAPGVHSARFAAARGQGNSPDSANLQKLLRVLKDVPEGKRTARFRCALALTMSHSVVLFEGACEGKIAFAPSGKGGFGYDPVFIPDGYTQTFAELGEDVKNQISHRARALQKLRHHLTSTFPTRGGPTPPAA